MDNNIEGNYQVLHRVRKGALSETQKINCLWQRKSSSEYSKRIPLSK